MSKLAFSGWGMGRRTSEIKKLIPSWYKQEYGSTLGSILFAFGESDTEVGGDIPTFVDTLSGPVVIRSGGGIVVPLGTVNLQVSNIGLWPPFGDVVIDTAVGSVERIHYSKILSGALVLDTTTTLDHPLNAQAAIPGSAVQDGLIDVTLKQATGLALTIQGQNFGVRRPVIESTNDSLFRRIVPLLSWQPKSVLRLFYQVLDVTLGDVTSAPITAPLSTGDSTVTVPSSALPFFPSSGNLVLDRGLASEERVGYFLGGDGLIHLQSPALRSHGLGSNVAVPGWALYEVNPNEVVIEASFSLPRTVHTASYLHMDETVDAPTGPAFLPPGFPGGYFVQPPISAYVTSPVAPGDVLLHFSPQNGRFISVGSVIASQGLLGAQEVLPYTAITAQVASDTTQGSASIPFIASMGSTFPPTGDLVVGVGTLRETVTYSSISGGYFTLTGTTAHPHQVGEPITANTLQLTSPAVNAHPAGDLVFQIPIANDAYASVPSSTVGGARITISDDPLDTLKEILTLVRAAGVVIRYIARGF